MIWLVLSIMLSLLMLMRYCDDVDVVGVVIVDMRVVVDVVVSNADIDDDVYMILCVICDKW